MDLSNIQSTIEEWENDPQTMFDWRSRALKVVLLVLHGIIAEKPNEKQRSQNMAKIRAAEQLGRLFEKMGAMRVDVPVVCPHCGQEHLVP